MAVAVLQTSCSMFLQDIVRGYWHCKFYAHTEEVVEEEVVEEEVEDDEENRKRKNDDVFWVLYRSFASLLFQHKIIWFYIRLPFRFDSKNAAYTLICAPAAGCRF